MFILEHQLSAKDVLILQKLSDRQVHYIAELINLIREVLNIPYITLYAQLSRLIASGYVQKHMNARKPGYSITLKGYNFIKSLDKLRS